MRYRCVIATLYIAISIQQSAVSLSMPEIGMLTALVTSWLPLLEERAGVR